MINSKLAAAAVTAALFSSICRGELGGLACGEEFQNVGSLTRLGWTIRNNSGPPGDGTWSQGDPGIFPAWSMPADSYASVGADSASGNFPVVSAWLITPAIDFDPAISARIFSFYTRALAGHANRLVVRLCVEDGVTPCRAPGPASGDIGGFNTTVLDINPDLIPNGYPTEWTQYFADNLPISGRARFAFHYYVFTQDNSYGTTIGIDALSIAGSDVCPFTDVVFASDFD